MYKEQRMNPIEKLEAEHQNILKGISLLQEGADRLEKGDKISADFFRKLIDFIRNYADKYHHAKEEDILFVRMEKSGFPTDTGPVGVMLFEHDQGRGFVSKMADAVEKYDSGDNSAINTIVENAQGYIYLLRQHIEKEDKVLYPMAANALGASGVEAMQDDFDRVEKEKTGTEEKYAELLKELRSYLDGLRG
jgi:hemerythrin-like domain-containing protein